MQKDSVHLDKSLTVPESRVKCIKQRNAYCACGWNALLCDGIGPDVYMVPEGWKLVPIKPTQAMCAAAQEKLREWPKYPFRVAPAYQAMLDAAPSITTTKEK